MNWQKACIAGSLLFLMFSPYTLSAQSPATIVRPLSFPSPSLLNPDRNNSSSASGAGYTNNDIAESEVPYKLVKGAFAEPSGDQAGASSTLDLVEGTDGGAFYIHSDGTNLFFRMRIDGLNNSSRGLSILIDTDERIGNQGPGADADYIAPSNTVHGNPGFEYEVVFNTGLNVKTYNINGSVSPLLVAQYSVQANAQVAVALSKNNGQTDYFYDWYVPLSSLGNPSSIRVAASTLNTAGSALTNSRSDVYGLDDRLFTTENAWQISAQSHPPLTINSSSITVDNRYTTSSPSIQGSVNSGSNIAVTGNWTATGSNRMQSATIALYKSGVQVGTATVPSGQQWSITVPSINTGDELYATAIASGELSSDGSPYIVADDAFSCQLEAPVINTNREGNLSKNSVSVSGTSRYPGETIKWYESTNPATVLGTTTVASNGSWTINGLTLQAGRSYYATLTSGSCNVNSAAAPVLNQTTTCPTITGSYSDKSTAVNGTINNSVTGTLRLYLDNVLIASTPINTTGNSNWTINPLPVPLYYNAQLKATFQEAGKTESSSCSAATVNCTPPLFPTVYPAEITISVNQPVSYFISNASSGSWYSVMDDALDHYASSMYRSDASDFTLPTRTFTEPGVYSLKINADPLSGCRSSNTSTTVTVVNESLPIRAIQLQLAQQRRTVKLHWRVWNEVNVSYYEVQRSIDGKNFYTINSIPAQTVARDMNDYLSVDVAVKPGARYYYRIEEMDIDGKFSYSPVVSIDIDASEKTVKVYPNPLTSNSSIQLSVDQRQTVMYRILDPYGRTLLQKSLQLEAGLHLLPLDHHMLPSSNYTVIVYVNEKKYSLQVMK